jgi:hypothetical protein
VRTVQELYDAVEEAINELASVHGIRLSEIKPHWTDVSTMGNANQYLLQGFEIDGSWHSVKR